MNILGDVECLKHLVGGHQLHVDHRLEKSSVEKADVVESGYSTGSMIINRICSCVKILNGQFRPEGNTCHSVTYDGIMCACI